MASGESLPQEDTQSALTANYGRNLSLRAKATIVIVLVSVLSVLILSVGFAVYDHRLYGQELMVDRLTQAEIIANTSTAAVAFRSFADAEEILQSLRSDQTVMAAHMFDVSGFVLATYGRGGEITDIPINVPEGAEGIWRTDRLEVFAPIVMDDTRIGTLHLVSDVSKLRARQKSYLYGGVVLILLGALVSLAFSWPLQKIITNPVRALLSTIRDVSRQKRYSVRAHKTTNDELGSLVDGFNDMLEQIERQDAELRQTHDVLEDRVRERTAELALEVEIRSRAQRDLKALAAELQRNNVELTRRNQELDEFTSLASHDLQEPVRKLQVFSELLIEDLGDNLSEDAAKDIDGIHRAATRMRTLIQDLLALSRTGKQADNQAKVNMDDVIESALENLSVTLAERNAVVETDPMPEIWGSDALLAQLLQNLISNGLKFNQSGQPKIRITADTSGEFVTFGVKDNGIGIKPEYQDRIFAPFRRLHSQEEYVGTGIGLALCKKIVDLHGGTIWVESTPGEGSHFRFTVWEHRQPELRSGKDDEPETPAKPEKPERVVT